MASSNPTPSVPRSQPWRARTRRLRARLAYTVIEVMMAMAVLSIGATGVIAMQKAALLGNVRAGRPRAMTIQNSRLGERLTGLGQFVTVKGGEYFFLPGMTALRYLSS